jgi:UDPglucose 6-dehydrogenase
LCERVGADIEQIRRAIGADGRIGPQFLFAGLGWGGSCFPKDVQALIRLGQDQGVELPIAQAAYHVNQKQRERFFSKIIEHFQGDLAGRTLAFWGLSFKPKTDDLRGRPRPSHSSRSVWGVARGCGPSTLKRMGRQEPSWERPLS